MDPMAENHYSYELPGLDNFIRNFLVPEELRCEQTPETSLRTRLGCSCKKSEKSLIFEFLMGSTMTMLEPIHKIKTTTKLIHLCRS